MSRAAAAALCALAACAHAPPVAFDGGPRESNKLPVVFVHGLGGDANMWWQTLERVRRSRRAIAFDLRGHGAAAPRDGYAIDDFAADVGAAADHAGLQRFVLVGYSLGASVAEAYAAAHPQRAAGLFLLDPTGDLSKAPREGTDALLRALRGPERQTYERRAFQQSCGDEAAAARLIDSTERARDDAKAGWVQSALAFGPAEALAKYQGPKLLVESGDGAEPYALSKLAAGETRQRISAPCAFARAPDELAVRIEAFASHADHGGVAFSIAGPAGKLRVEDGGPAQGTPLLFVHGLGGSLELWRDQLDHFRAARRAVAIDLRGHGGSEPGGEISSEKMAEDVGAALDALGISRAVLVGHSLGAHAIAAYAASHPDRVAGLVLVDAAFDFRKMPAKALASMLSSARRDPEFMRNLATQLCGQRRSTLEAVLASGARANPKALLGWFEAAPAGDPERWLRSFAGPKLLLVAQGHENAAALHVLIPELPRRTIAASHCLQLDEPEAVNAEIDGFLSRMP